MSSGVDYPLEETIHFLFTTRSFSTGAPTQLAGTPVLSVYEDASTTQITSGVSLGVDHDTVTGLNLGTVVATAANGYESGKSYHLVITTGTVGGVSVVGEVVGNFTIERSAAAVDLANGTDGLGAIKSETALIVADTNELQTDDVPGLIAALNDPTAATIADAVWDEATSAHISIGSFGERSGTDSGNIGNVVSNTSLILTDTADMQPKLGTPAADLAADIAAIKAETASILTDTGTTLDTKLNDIQGATFSSATDSLEAIRDRGDAAWTTGAGGTPPQLLQNTTIATLASQTSFTLTAGSADDDAYNNAIAVVTDSATSTQKAVGTVSDYTGSTKTVTLSADPGIFVMAVGDTIDIIAALGSAGSAPTAAAIADAVWDEAQADHVAAGSFGVTATEIADILTDTADMQPKLGAPAADLAADVAAVKAETALIVADTNELQTDDVPGLIAALNDPTAAAIADAVWDETQATHVTAGSFGELATEIASILADTNELQSDDVPGLIAALNDVAATDILASALTEDYAADGATFTVSQALYMIWALLAERSIVTTTLTAKKLDGSTAAMTFTLDDATTPTSQTRAT